MPGKETSCESLKIIYLLAVLLCLLTLYVQLSDNLIIYSYEEDGDLEKPVFQVIVDLDQYCISVYKDGVLIRTYPCSGGKSDTPSPTGEFKIISKDKWGEGFGGVWMGLSVPWGTFGIHGTKRPWVVGKKHVSKGCIRMLTKDAEELADIVPLDTPVKIVQKNRPYITHYLGESGPEIWNAQVTLHSLGYYDGEFDGKFGKQLREAVLKFQKDNGLKETGSLNQKTYDKILEQQVT